MRKDPLLAPRQPRAAAKTTGCHNYANYDIAMSNRRCSRFGGGDQVAAGRTVAAHGHGAMCGSSRLLLVVEAVGDNPPQGLDWSSVVGRRVGLVGCGGVLQEASAAASQRCRWGTPPCQPV
eukprot:scaffold161132_cov47-Attheya_sp.AAC.1